MKISVHLITWGGDWRRGLVEAGALGYRACETFTHHAMEFADDPAALRAVLDEHGFRLSALYGGGRFSDPSTRADVVAGNRRVAELLAALGADRIVFGPGGPRTEGGTTPDELREIVRTVDEAGRACADVGVVPCVHPHLFTEIEQRHELDAVMEGTGDHVKLCIDTAHTTKAGMDPTEVIRTYGERLRYLHLKDVTPADADATQFPDFTHGEALPIFCELGLGIVDLPGVKAALDDIGYDGWVTLEIDQSTSTPSRSLEICRDYVEREWGVAVSSGAGA